MNKNVYVTEKIFKFLSLSLVGIALRFVVSYGSNSKEFSSSSLNGYKPKTVEATQNLSMKSDNHSLQSSLEF